MPGSQRSFPGINICIYLTKNLVPQLYPLLLNPVFEFILGISGPFGVGACFESFGLSIALELLIFSRLLYIWIEKTWPLEVMSFLFGMSLRGFSSLHCSLPYIQSWGMLLQRGCIYKLEFYHCKIILGGNDRQQYNCNNNQCCSLIKSLLKSGILVLETALGLALWLSWLHYITLSR